MDDPNLDFIFMDHLLHVLSMLVITPTAVYKILRRHLACSAGFCTMQLILQLHVYITAVAVLFHFSAP